MNATTEKQLPVRPVKPAPVEKQAAIPEVRDLSTTISAICQDAQINSLRYVLRSNTGHDGE